MIRADVIQCRGMGAKRRKLPDGLERSLAGLEADAARLAHQKGATPAIAAAAESVRARLVEIVGELRRFTRPGEAPGELPSPLTRRQREVLILVAEGRSLKQMAAILGVSPKTVEFHKAALTGRLGIRTTAQLTRYAIEQGLV
jgi:DNA-binding CsgD family transcriptional regulator